MSALTPTLLLILDGWGQAPAGPGNAEKLAAMPNINALTEKYPAARLTCSGRSVGLPYGFMGNSEVGHMNIGAGRIVYQDMTRIDLAIENREFEQNPAINGLMDATLAAGGRLHFLGLVSDGGVHSHIDHLFALLDLAKAKGLEAIVHCFTDGRDTAPDSGVGFVGQLDAYMAKIGWGRIGSICGRYYAMDRDKRWDRVKLAWDMLTKGESAGETPAGSSPVEAVKAAYAADETDEFIKPRFLTAPAGKTNLVADSDGVFFFNFRADRARQLTRCFIERGFAEVDVSNRPKLAGFATMTRYESDFDVPVAFAKLDLSKALGELVSDMGLKQLRIAETEKYAHVTYFFNCGREEPFPGEERRLIPSPRDVATYDLKPQMSALEVTDTLIKEWQSGQYTLMVCNLANLDMVGHSGKIPAVIKACEVVDACVGRIVETVLGSGGRVFLTADHGNAEEMLTPEGKPQTAHSLNQVFFVGIDNNKRLNMKAEGKLGDIAPTILQAWGIEPPEVMTGESLLI